MTKYRLFLPIIGEDDKSATVDVIYCRSQWLVNAVGLVATRKKTSRDISAQFRTSGANIFALPMSEVVSTGATFDTDSNGCCLSDKWVGLPDAAVYVMNSKYSNMKFDGRRSLQYLRQFRKFLLL